MQLQLQHDTPIDRCTLWQFDGFVGTVDYLPPMNDSIGPAMLDQDETYAMLINMGWAVPLPRQPFRVIAQVISGAPPNLRRVVIVSQNPLTREVIALTMGREPTLSERLRVVSSLDVGRELVEQSLQT